MTERFWMCPNCRERVAPEDTMYDTVQRLELHIDCGRPLDWSYHPWPKPLTPTDSTLSNTAPTTEETSDG